MTKRRKSRHSFGTVRQLPSGRWQATYRHEGKQFTAPATFPNKTAAQTWLAGEQSDRTRGVWTDPRLGEVTLTDYAREWLANRTDLAPRTRALYERSLEQLPLWMFLACSESNSHRISLLLDLAEEDYGKPQNMGSIGRPAQRCTFRGQDQLSSEPMSADSRSGPLEPQ